MKPPVRIRGRLAIETEAARAALARITRLERDLRWALRHDGGECPADDPPAYAEVLADLLSVAAPAAPAAPALDTERRAVVAAAAIFLAAHDRVIASNPVTRDDTFAMKNAADTLRDVLREYARLANPEKP